MNELNKLIQQYSGDKIMLALILEDILKSESPKLMILSAWIRDIASRPTCGKEQRKFLDYIETMNSMESLGHPYIDTIWQDDTEADLQKVVQGE